MLMRLGTTQTKKFRFSLSLAFINMELPIQIYQDLKDALPALEETETSPFPTN